MYVPPELHRIGDARDVVLGVVDLGADLDGTRLISDMEYPFPLLPVDGE